MCCGEFIFAWPKQQKQILEIEKKTHTHTLHTAHVVAFSVLQLRYRRYGTVVYLYWQSKLYGLHITVVID